MRKHSTKTVEQSGNSTLGAISRLAKVASEFSAQDQQTTIDTLMAQALRYETIVDKISQGICFFDGDQRLIMANRRYSEIYNLRPSDVAPGTVLRTIAERRSAVGTCPMSVDDYIAWCHSVNLGTQSKTKTLELKDGRTIHICHQPMPDGGWVATHEDITELKAKRMAAHELLSLQTLMDLVPDYLWVKDRDSRFVVANKSLASDWGHAHPSEIIGLNDFDFHPPDVAEVFATSERDLLRTGVAKLNREESVFNSDGVKKWILSSKVPLRNESNEIVGIVGIARDITERKKAEILRDGEAQILEMIALNAPLHDVLKRIVLLVESQLDNIHCTILLLDSEGKHLRHAAGPSMPQDYINAIDGVRIGPDVGSCGTAAYRQETVIVSDIPHDPLWRNYRELAKRFGLVSCWSTPIFSHDGAVLGTFAMYSGSVREPSAEESKLVNVSTRIAGIAIARKQAEDRIWFLANHDALTGLPNRTLLKDRLSQALLHAKRFNTWVTVIFLDLDNFKTVNDSLGHNAGDELLKTVAKRMTTSVRSTDSVVRLGGDEFVILLPDLPKNPDLISKKLQELRATLAETIHLEGHDISVTASVGIANYPDDATDAVMLLANADAAMYRAKEMGRDNFQFYTPEMNTKVHDKFKLHEELRNAVMQSQFKLVYQPQADLRTGRIFAVEALIRWNHPTQGLVAPLKFMPLAEETGLIVPIGDWVLHEACRQNMEWQDGGFPHITVCVNVSARQFREKNLVSRVVHALEQTGLDAKYLELEITESIIMQDIEQAVLTMEELAALGVQISIDDFGTGYSSLSALKAFPVARLKIDRSFISNLAHNGRDRAVASAVISLGQKLNLRVIAEGVETIEQVEFLRDENCDEIQGYHLSMPIDPTAIENLLMGTAKT
jgi:diguanylate cyclase (GGDEF)-like protein/PAS domain S-box-containing protein